MVRYAPLPVDPNAPGGGRGAGRGDKPAAGAPATGPTLPAAPGAPTGPPTAAGGPGRAGFPGGAPPGGRGRGAVFNPTDWNDIGVIADGNTLRRLLGQGVASSQAVDMSAFGAVAFEEHLIFTDPSLVPGRRLHP